MATPRYQGRANMAPITPAKAPVMGLRKLPPATRGGTAVTVVKGGGRSMGANAGTAPASSGGFRRLPPVSPTKGGVGMASGGGPKVPPANMVPPKPPSPGTGMKVPPATQADGGRRGAPAGGSPKPVTRPAPIVAGKARPNAQAMAHANANASFKRGAAKPKPKVKPKAKAKMAYGTESRRYTSKIVEHTRPRPTTGEARQAATTRQHKAMVAAKAAPKRPAPKRESTKAAFLARKSGG